MSRLDDPDPLGHPTWTNRMVRRPSIDPEGLVECEPGETGLYEIVNNKELYQIKIESFMYEPEEISVNRDPDNPRGVVVVGKKLDKETKQVIVDSVFYRKFTLPNEVKYESLKKTYAPNGVTIIEAVKTK